MAEGTRKAASISNRPRNEKIVNFAPERVRAPFFLRCAAVAVDYIILIILPVFWLLISKLISDTPSGVSIAAFSWYAGVILSILNLLILPLWKGQSVGKMVTGLVIVEIDGSNIGTRSLVLRNGLGYTITLLTFGLGFFISAVNNSGRALHDYLAGTVVVRGRKSRVS